MTTDQLLLTFRVHSIDSLGYFAIIENLNLSGWGETAEEAVLACQKKLRARLDYVRPIA